MAMMKLRTGPWVKNTADRWRFQQRHLFCSIRIPVWKMGIEIWQHAKPCQNLKLIHSSSQAGNKVRANSLFMKRAFNLGLHPVSKWRFSQHNQPAMACKFQVNSCNKSLRLRLEKTQTYIYILLYIYNIILIYIYIYYLTFWQGISGETSHPTLGSLNSANCSGISMIGRPLNMQMNHLDHTEKKQRQEICHLPTEPVERDDEAQEGEQHDLRWIWVCLKIVYHSVPRKTQWLMIIIPTKWL